MRLSNERDQELIRSAVSDAAANLLSFVPSLGTREVFAFGPRIALPTRMRFCELPQEMRPNSEASGNTRSDAGRSMDHDLLSSVIERWRSASISHRIVEDESSFEAPLQPSPMTRPLSPPPVSPLRASLLKKRLEAASLSPAPPPGTSRFR